MRSRCARTGGSPPTVLILLGLRVVSSGVVGLLLSTSEESHSGGEVGEKTGGSD